MECNCYLLVAVVLKALVDRLKTKGRFEVDLFQECLVLTSTHDQEL